MTSASVPALLDREVGIVKTSYLSLFHFPVAFNISQSVNHLFRFLDERRIQMFALQFGNQAFFLYGSGLHSQVFQCTVSDSFLRPVQLLHVIDLEF